jgi:hypothetical protein
MRQESCGLEQNRAEPRCFKAYSNVDLWLKLAEPSFEADKTRIKED